MFNGALVSLVTIHKFTNSQVNYFPLYHLRPIQLRWLHFVEPLLHNHAEDVGFGDDAG